MTTQATPQNQPAETSAEIRPLSPEDLRTGERQALQGEGRPERDRAPLPREAQAVGVARPEDCEEEERPEAGSDAPDRRQGRRRITIASSLIPGPASFC